MINYIILHSRLQTFKYSRAMAIYNNRLFSVSSCIHSDESSDDSSEEELEQIESTSSSSSSDTPTRVNTEKVRYAIRRAIQKTQATQNAVDDLNRHTMDIETTYEGNMYNEGTDKKDRRAYMKREKVELWRYNVAKAHALEDTNRHNAPEKAKELIAIKQEANKARAEFVESKGIQPDSDDERFLLKSTDKQIFLKEKLEKKAEAFKSQINKLEKLEEKLENQPNKEVVKQSLIDDYADLSTEIMDIVDFD